MMKRRRDEEDEGSCRWMIRSCKPFRLIHEDEGSSVMPPSELPMKSDSWEVSKSHLDSLCFPKSIIMCPKMMERSRDEEDECPTIIRRCTQSPFKFKFNGGIETSHGVTWIRRHKLGQGGFASVYSATSTSYSAPSYFLDCNGSFRIMPSEFAVKSVEISKSSSLRTEMEILSRLNSSSYVVRCYGDEITKSRDGKLYYNIFMEKCFGGSLGSRIRNSGGIGLPENEVRSITRDIVRGLCYIHGRGYVHCDIKPDNILLVPACYNSFKAKIGDFGLAKAAFDEPTDEDELRGTWRYMSPESLACGMQGWLSDVSSLGCVVIEMFSGKPVWSSQRSERRDMRDLLRRIACSSELPEFPNTISKKGRQFLEICLDRNINRRWSALKLLQHPFISEDGGQNIQFQV